MNKSLKMLILLTVVSAGILLISNLAATKLWNFFGIPVDGGVIVFPISYIIGDLIVELFSKKWGDFAVYVSFFLNLFASIVFLIVGLLPEFAGWGHQDAYDTILGFTPRIVIGSLAAYLVSGLVNNIVFVKIKNKTGNSKLMLRTIGSSLPAKFIDSMIFETVAFIGVLPFSDFLIQAFFAFLTGIFLEIILTPLTYLIVNFARKKKIGYEFLGR